jgi:hypothetical protein
MPWPTLSDYRETVQNPKLAFDDPELQSGHAELDHLGLPRPRSGGFASVYKMRCGQRDWAVRCFLRDFADQQKRYASISDHLSRNRIPYMVGFSFLRQGIRVRGQWYPILKMEWVQGEPLHIYIERNLGRPGDLLSLANRWVQLVQTLQQAGLAHGDLQHGNVFVIGGHLRLIDYDGMYVPSLSGEVSHEVGHRNYQHPMRNEFDFGPYLDNFPAWVVYVSLIALSIDPQLWARFSGGDECLLFRKKDFEQPETSDIVHALEYSSDARIRSVGTLFKSLFYLGPQQVPSLDGQLNTFPQNNLVSSRSGWIDDHVEPSKVAAKDSPAKSEANPANVDPSWIFGFVPSNDTSDKLSCQNSVLPERIVLGTSTVAVLFFFFAVSTSGVPVWAAITIGIVLAVLINSAFLIYSYHLEPRVKDLIVIKAKLKSITSQITTTGSERNSIDKARTKHCSKYTADQAKITKEQKAIEAMETKEVAARDRTLQSSLSTIHGQRQKLSQQQGDELVKSKVTLGRKWLP